MSLPFSTVRLSRFSYAFLALLLLALLDGAGLDWLHATDRFGGDLLLRLHARSRPAPDNIILLDIDQIARRISTAANITNFIRRDNICVAMNTKCF